MKNIQTKTNEELKTQREELKTQHEELKTQHEKIITLQEELKTQQEEKKIIHKELQAKNILLNNVTSLLTSHSTSLSELPQPPVCKQPTNSSLGGADCDLTTNGGRWTIVQVCVCVCVCVCV